MMTKNEEYIVANRQSNTLKRFALMFAIFYTSLTLLSKLAVAYGFLTRNFMDSLIFGVVDAALLSLLFIKFSPRADR